MTAVTRIISGSTAAWTQIIVNMIGQVAVVPIYLTFWTTSEYGLWLTIITFIPLLQIFDYGHHQFVGMEFLKNGTEKSAELSRLLFASIPIAIAIGMLQILFAWCLIHSGLIGFIFSYNGQVSKTLLDQAQFFILASVIVFGLSNSVGGILVRLMYVFDYYARMAWWGVLYASITLIVPAVSVCFGGGILQAGMAWVVATLIYYVFVWCDIYRLLQKSSIGYIRPDLILGIMNFLRSVILTLVSLFTMMRQQGIRIVLVPLAGVVNVATFTTIRTLTNITIQGLGTITGPLMPEFMRVLRDRDQARCEITLGLIWLILIACMAPTVVVLQYFVEPLFLIWTRGQIEFNPSLFGVLSIGVLIYTWTQPAFAIVMGNNLLRPQLTVAVLSAMIVILGMIVLIPILGLLGAGIALLIAEILSSILYRRVAIQWLSINGLDWPKKSSWLAVNSILISAIAIILLVMFQNISKLTLIVTLILLFLNLIFFWRSLPELARVRAQVVLQKFTFQLRCI